VDIVFLSKIIFAQIKLAKAASGFVRTTSFRVYEHRDNFTYVWLFTTAVHKFTTFVSKNYLPAVN
jgi:hypothetical protein